MIKEYIAYIKDNPKGYWFKAKPFGWGWTPVRWQGWTVIGIFLLLIVGNVYRMGLQPHHDKVSTMNVIIPTIVLVLVLIAICFKTGERPHWQWGWPRKQSK